MFAVTHLVGELLEVGRELLRRDVQEARVTPVGGAERQQVDGGEARLLARRHEDDRRPRRRVTHDRRVGRLRHRHEARRVVRRIEALQQRRRRETSLGGATTGRGDVSLHSSPKRPVFLQAQRT